MQANINIQTDVLTPTEKKVYCLNGVGKQTKEIAELLHSSYETAKSHMKNIKVKLGLQKDKEITAHFWCSLSGKDFDQVKRQIMASCLLAIFLVCIPLEHDPMRETKTCRTRANRSVVARRNPYTA